MIYSCICMSGKLDIVELFNNISKKTEHDSRYEETERIIPRCRKGLEYTEKDSGISLVVRYWDFSWIQWKTFIRLIKHLENLQELRIIGCKIDDTKLVELVKVLRTNRSLTILDLSENIIHSIDPIKYLINLCVLDISLNGYIEIIQPISKLVNLQYLNLRVNIIKDLSPISNLTNLQKLDLSLNQINDISPIWRLRKLTYLDLSANMQLRYIGQLSGLSLLLYLNLCACDIRSRAYIDRLNEYLPDCKIISRFSEN